MAKSENGKAADPFVEALQAALKKERTVVPETAPEVTVKTVSSPNVEQIVLPESMNKLEAAIQLKKQWDEEETLVDVFHSFVGWEAHDAMVAIMRTIRSKLGWVPGKPIHSFFGTTYPHEIDVPVGIKDGRVINESCFWGDFEVSQWDQARASVRIDRDARPMPLTFIRINLKKKFAERARQFIEAAEQELRTNSIYRGKAIAVSRDPEVGPKFDFFEAKGAPHIVLNQKEEGVLRDLVIGPLGTTGKRCILFVGTYGSGKTETAMRVGLEATRRGITFMYCKEASMFNNVLELAKRYQPALIFMEDVDEIGSGEERTTEMNEILNTLDGVQTKGNELTVIFTTNHERRINKALRRPGRIDIILPFGKCEVDTIAKIYRKLLEDESGGESLDYEMLADKTPADVQGAIVAEIAKRALDIARSHHGRVLSNDIVLNAISSMEYHITFMREDAETQLDPRAAALQGVADVISQAVHASPAGGGWELANGGFVLKG